MEAQVAGGRNDAAVQRFVERFSSVLAETGWPRMPARVFVTLLASDEGRMTSAELAEVLHVSPAAISGAVRYLSQVDLASRERVPGTRRDVYRVHDDVWYEAATRRDQILARYDSSLREGIAALGPRSPAARRLSETLEFFEFIGEELQNIITRWQARKLALRGGSEVGAQA
jgi:DNA-binding transcriptional regulator GbsR (MarR family)